ncbi:MAG: Flp pilus assembly complex ATPase component TadA [Candidatus Omnitrophica bacterium]|nr:Flp pilus assembly complex ATPase component TadA [Candidatus Omnitrophota bacterium]
MAVQPIGELLRRKQMLSEERLSEALKEQEATKAPLNAILLKRGWVTPEQLSQVLAEQYQMRFVRLRETAIDRSVIDQVPLKVALHYTVMPVSLAGSKLTVAVANPQDVRTLDGLRIALQGRFFVEPVLATEEDILQTLKKCYGVAAETVDRLVADRTGRGAQEFVEEKIEDIEQMAGDASVVKLVNQLLLEAHSRRATDVHLEPYRGKVRLRYRIDGMLHDVDVPPTLRQLFPAIISRIKVLSNLNLMERRLPQDGRASVKVGEEKLDLRIAVLPISSGESIVIRILPNQMLLGLQDLGFREGDRKILEAIVRKPHGLVFLTGPTGSGKTTTLYACLNALNSEDKKIITIEDPVEYEIENIAQVQVNPAIQLTFARALRSMLRHDPDVIMVGEVRDLETAEMVIRIALTGHMVLSTLHTNDAVGGIARLMDMDIEPFLIASSVECIIAQRLVRLLCPKCKKKVSGSMGTQVNYEAAGCAKCHQTGFLGRQAIYEFFVMSQPIQELVQKKTSGDVIRKAAIEYGMKTMRESGLEMVEQGLTSLDEVLRVTQDEI